MAIVADLIAVDDMVRLPGSKADALQFPPKKVDHISAAGFVDIAADAEVFVFHNLASSQTVSIRLNTDADGTAASPSDNKSVRVDVGESVTFGLPKDTDATGYKLSVV